MKYKRIVFALVFVATLLIGGVGAIAQPVMTFTRLVNNWPTVELYFKMACNGQPVYVSDKSKFRVAENGVAIPDFTLWCPDPRQRCAVSVALVFDASGSMSGSNNAGSKAAGLKFIELMDGIVDEAAIIFASSVVSVKLPMTTNKTDLADAVNDLPASGGSAMWDGIFEGVSQVVANGGNPCRAVIALTDGGDNSSAHTPDEIIALANRNRVRVFAVAIGSVTPTQLQTIALLTGGQYYQAPSASQVVAIFEEIGTIIMAGFFECLITYEATCMDGGIRTVDLSLMDYCNGSDSKSRSYRAPRDTTTWTALGIDIGGSTGFPGREIALPISLDRVISPPTNWYNAMFEFSYNPAELVFNKITTPPGTILESVPYIVDAQSGKVKVTVQDRRLIDGLDVVCFLHFTPLALPDTTVSPITFDSWVFEAGCFLPVLGDGEIVIMDSNLPHIYPSGTIKLCEGESLVLTALDGFTDYIWSTGATGRTLTVDSAGSYWVSAMGTSGRDTAGAVTVISVQIPNPTISPYRDTTICEGQSLRISAGAGYSKYEWSNGSKQESITVDSAGRYYVRVQNADGCWGYSSAINVAVAALPEPVISGKSVFCTGDTIQQYTVGSAQGMEHQWSVTDGTIIGFANNPTVTVDWNPGAQGSISVVQTETATGCTGAASLQVSEIPLSAELSIPHDSVICGDTQIQISAPAGYESYLWSTGETTSSITVADDGYYYVTVTVGNCSAKSETIHLTFLDEITAIISGDNVVCQSEIVSYTATMLPGASYFWNALTGNVVAGQGTSTAQIEWPHAGYMYLSVVATLGGCTSDDTLVVRIESNESFAIQAGDTVLCEGESTTLSAPGGYASYLWSTGDTSRNITVTQSGTYTVTVRTINGCEATSFPMGVTVNPRPQKPVITQNGNVLTCSVAGMTYIWSLNGTRIQGESRRTLTMTASGNYTVTVVDTNRCTTESDVYALTGIGQYAPGLARTFGVSPNPSDGLFTVSIDFERPSAFTLRLMNMAGQSLYERNVPQPATGFREQIRLDNAPSGMYFFILESGAAYDFRKVVIR